MSKSKSTTQLWEERVTDLKNKISDCQLMLNDALEAIKKIENVDKIKKVGFTHIRKPLQEVRNEAKIIRDKVTAMKEFALDKFFK